MNKPFHTNASSTCRRLHAKLKSAVICLHQLDFQSSSQHCTAYLSEFITLLIHIACSFWICALFILFGKKVCRFLCFNTYKIKEMSQKISNFYNFQHVNLEHVQCPKFASFALRSYCMQPATIGRQSHTDYSLFIYLFLPFFFFLPI